MAKRKQAKPRARSPNAGEEKSKEELSRRAFLRKSAEIAAIALFGTLTLDEITDKVLERLASWSSATRIGNRAAARLRESLGPARAWGDSCPIPYCTHPYPCSGFDDYCRMGGATNDTFYCTAPPDTAYKCETKFWCDDVASSFRCNRTGQANQWFGCGVGEESGGNFKCGPSEGHTGTEFRCGIAGQPATDFHCSELVSCSHDDPQATGFICSSGGSQADPYFDCTTEPISEHYTCPRVTGQRFFCSRTQQHDWFTCDPGYVGPVWEGPAEKAPEQP